jgi:hypothetical protein
LISINQQNQHSFIQNKAYSVEYLNPSDFDSGKEINGVPINRFPNMNRNPKDELPNDFPHRRRTTPFPQTKPDN